MENKDTMLNHSLSSKTAIVWLIVLVLIVIIFMGIGFPELKNPWTQSLEDMENVISSKQKDSKLEIIEKTGKNLLKVQSEYNMHPILNIYVGYYFFSIGKMDSVIYYQTKALDKMKDFPKNNLSNKSQDLLINAVFNKSLKYIRSGDSASAFKLYANAVNYAPDNSHLNKVMGDFYLNQNKIEAAMYHYYAAKRNNKNDVELLYKIGKIYLSRGITDSVRHYANLITKIKPDSSQALQLLDLNNESK